MRHTFLSTSAPARSLSLPWKPAGGAFLLCPEERRALCLEPAQPPFLSGRRRIALCLLVSIYAAGQRGTTGPISSIFGVVLTPLQKGVSTIAYFVSDKLAYFTRYDELQEENAQLKEQVLELEQKAARL